MNENPLQRPMLYILKGDEPVAVTDEDVWIRFMAEENRKIRVTECGPLVVSTVFMAIDHALEGRPELFETMVFVDGEGGEFLRCFTYHEALEQHKKMCLAVGLSDLLTDD